MSNMSAGNAKEKRKNRRVVWACVLVKSLTNIIDWPFPLFFPRSAGVFLPPATSHDVCMHGDGDGPSSDVYISTVRELSLDSTREGVAQKQGPVFWHRRLSLHYRKTWSVGGCIAQYRGDGDVTCLRTFSLFPPPPFFPNSSDIVTSSPSFVFPFLFHHLYSSSATSRPYTFGYDAWPVVQCSERGDP